MTPTYPYTPHMWQFLTSYDLFAEIWLVTWGRWRFDYPVKIKAWGKGYSKPHVAMATVSSIAKHQVTEKMIIFQNDWGFVSTSLVANSGW